MDKLGKMIRITDLRSVWPHEANDFTKWLAQEENLTLLGDAIDIELELEERESSVGSFNVDIFAKEVGTNRRSCDYRESVRRYEPRPSWQTDYIRLR